ncbi:putative transcription factor C2C2-GATA family [Helianthus annuus]|nr:putative transcription factor C2C2-GATA family [Helianthus annuus]KAJ0684038.1 putative transcription factor C2C2-GATA family [Helianthus annuus]KAJ0687994.1 putative transcription factor C2C2-GATA family [Helianthus annuus]
MIKIKSWIRLAQPKIATRSKFQCYNLLIKLNLQSLCNACGIRFKKEERRANAAATATTNVGDTTETQHYQQMMNMNANPWVHHTQATHKLPSCYSPAASKVNEFRFIDDVDDRDSPFLSWRLNVTDGPGLVHGFTR